MRSEDQPPLHTDQQLQSWRRPKGVQIGCAEVPFERPVAALSSLIKLYVLGQPALAGTERDVADMIPGSLLRRGLTLDAASGLQGAGSERIEGHVCTFAAQLRGRSH